MRNIVTGTLTKSLLDATTNKFVEQIGSVAVNLLTQVVEGRDGEAPVPIIISGYISGTETAFENLYNIFSSAFVANNEFSKNLKSKIIGKNRTTLFIQNASKYVLHPKKLKNPICLELCALLSGYIVNNKQGADDQKNEIDNIKVYAVSLLLTALTIIDEQIDSSETRGLTMRHLLLRIRNICGKFLENDKVTESSESSGFGMKTLLETVMEKISTYNEECDVDDAKTILQDNVQRLDEKIGVINYESRKQEFSLIFNSRFIPALFSNEENLDLMMRTTDYESFKKEVEKFGSESTDLTEIVKDNESYLFVKKYIFNIVDESPENTEQKESAIKKTKDDFSKIKKILAELPGTDKDKDGLKQSYLEQLTEIVFIVSECHKSVQEIEIIRKILSIMGESGGIWGNLPIKETLKNAKIILLSIAAKFKEIEKRGDKLSVKHGVTDGPWASNLKSMTKFLAYANASSSEAIEYLEKMEKALVPQEALSRFRAVTEELRSSAASKASTNQNQATLHILDSTATHVEAKFAETASTTPEVKRTEDIKSSPEIKRQGESDEEKLPHIQSDVQLEEKELKQVINELVKAIPIPNVECLKSIYREYALPHPSKMFGLSLPHSYIVAPVHNPEVYFSNTPQFKRVTTAKLMSEIENYWTYKKEAKTARSRSSKESIYDYKIFALSILIGYIEQLDQIETGEIYGESANKIIVELAKVVTTLSGMDIIKKSGRVGNHSFIGLLKSLQKLTESYTKQKDLVDAQKTVHLNARKVDSGIRLISFSYESSLLEILFGKPIDYILATPKVVKNLKDSATYEEFKRKNEEKLSPAAVKTLHKTIANEDDYQLIKTCFLESKIDEEVIKRIVGKKCKSTFKIKDESNETYKTLVTLLTSSVGEFVQLKKLIEQHQLLLSISAFWGNLSAALIPNLKESNRKIKDHLTKIQTTMTQIADLGKTLAATTENVTTWGKSFDKLKKNSEYVSETVSEVSSSIGQIESTLDNGKMFDQYRDGIDLITQLRAFKADKSGKSQEMLALAESFIKELEKQFAMSIDHGAKDKEVKGLTGSGTSPTQTNSSGSVTGGTKAFDNPEATGIRGITPKVEEDVKNGPGSRATGTLTQPSITTSTAPTQPPHLADSFAIVPSITTTPSTVSRSSASSTPGQVGTGSQPGTETPATSGSARNEFKDGTPVSTEISASDSPNKRSSLSETTRVSESRAEEYEDETEEEKLPMSFSTLAGRQSTRSKTEEMRLDGKLSEVEIAKFREADHILGEAKKYKTQLSQGTGDKVSRLEGQIKELGEDLNNARNHFSSLGSLSNLSRDEKEVYQKLRNASVELKKLEAGYLREIKSVKNWCVGSGILCIIGIGAPFLVANLWRLYKANQDYTKFQGEKLAVRAKLKPVQERVKKNIQEMKETKQFIEDRLKALDQCVVKLKAEVKPEIDKIKEEESRKLQAEFKEVAKSTIAQTSIGFISAPVVDVAKLEAKVRGYEEKDYKNMKAIILGIYEVLHKTVIGYHGSGRSAEIGKLKPAMKLFGCWNGLASKATDVRDLRPSHINIETMQSEYRKATQGVVNMLEDKNKMQTNTTWTETWKALSETFVSIQDWNKNRPSRKADETLKNALKEFFTPEVLNAFKELFGKSSLSGDLTIARAIDGSIVYKIGSSDITPNVLSLDSFIRLEAQGKEQPQATITSNSSIATLAS